MTKAFRRRLSISSCAFVSQSHLLTACSRHYWTGWLCFDPKSQAAAWQRSLAAAMTTREVRLDRAIGTRPGPPAAAATNSILTRAEAHPPATASCAEGFLITVYSGVATTYARPCNAPHLPTNGLAVPPFFCFIANDHHPPVSCMTTILNVLVFIAFLFLKYSCLKYSPTSTQAIKMLGRQHLRSLPFASQHAALCYACRFKADHSVLKAALGSLLWLPRPNSLSERAHGKALFRKTEMPVFKFVEATLAALPLRRGFRMKMFDYFSHEQNGVSKVSNSLNKYDTCVLVAHAVETDVDAASVAGGSGDNIAKAKDSSLLVFAPPTLDVDVRSAWGVTQLVVGEQLPGSTPTKCSEADSWSVYVVEDFKNEEMMKGAVELFCKALRALPRMSLRDYLLHCHPADRKVTSVRSRCPPLMEATVCIATSESEWDSYIRSQVHFGDDVVQLLHTIGRRVHTKPVRYNDYTQGVTNAEPSIASSPRPEVPPTIFAADDPKVTQLVGGESGSGKSMLMLAGRSDAVDLVVYVAQPTHSSWLFLLGEVGLTHDAAFKKLVVTWVTSRLGPELSDIIHASGEENGGTVYRVRFAFDDAGSETQFVRALCSVGAEGIHDALGWPANVKVHAVIGGTGIGSLQNLGGSSAERYRLTTLQPSLNVWQSLRATAETSNPLQVDDETTRTMICLFNAVEADFMCRGAVTNPRLAVLIATGCWRRAKILVDDLNFKNLYSTSKKTFSISKKTYSTDVRTEVLLPAVDAFQALSDHWSNPLTNVELTRRALLTALRHAVLPRRCDDAVNLSKELGLLERTYGVLVDNAYFKKRGEVDANVESIVLDAKGREVVNSLNDEDIEASLLPGLNTKQKHARAMASEEVACYPTAKGRYSIPLVMVSVLYLLLECEFDDKFEAALAQMMCIALHVYEGRPVAELLRHLFGSGAVKDSVLCAVKGKVVALRRPKTMKKAAANAAVLDFQLLTEAEGVAWVEVSPQGLPSADLVVHIPGALTIAVRWQPKKFRGKTCRKKLARWLCFGNPTAVKRLRTSSLRRA